MGIINLLTEEKIAEIIRNSYKDFHTKGLDYLCWTRTEEETIKYYFFDGEVSQLPEVVHPHDHRYMFFTTVLAGQVANVLYVDDDRHGEVFQEFQYRTPLNGGDGFTWRREVMLRACQDTSYHPQQYYVMDPQEIHTIRIEKPGTVLALTQKRDVYAIDHPTYTFTKDKDPIDLSGLYRKFTEDEVIKRIKQIDLL
jgi:hypothetical protein